MTWVLEAFGQVAVCCSWWFQDGVALTLGGKWWWVSTITPFKSFWGEKTSLLWSEAIFLVFTRCTEGDPTHLLRVDPLWLAAYRLERHSGCLVEIFGLFQSVFRWFSASFRCFLGGLQMFLRGLLTPKAGFWGFQVGDAWEAKMPICRCWGKRQRGEGTRLFALRMIAPPMSLYGYGSKMGT